MNHCSTVSARRYDKRQRLAEIFGERGIVVYKKYVLLERKDEESDLMIPDPKEAERNGWSDTCRGLLKGAEIPGTPWSKEGTSENGSVWFKRGLLYECKADEGDDDENALLTKLDRLAYVIDLADAWEIFESCVESVRE